MAIAGTEAQLAQRWKDLFAASGFINEIDDALYDDVLQKLAQGVVEHIVANLQTQTVVPSGSSAGTYVGTAL